MRIQGCIVAVTLALFTLTACTGGGRMGDPRRIEPVAVSLPGPHETTVDPQTAALAAQAERDVADLSALQSGSAERQTTPSSPDVQWILPSPEPPPAVRAATAAAGGQKSLHRDSSAAAETEFAVEGGELPAPNALTDLVVVPAPVEDESPGATEERLDQLIVDLSRELYQQAAYSDVPLRPLLLIAATTMLDPQRAIAPDAIPGLTDRERELLSVVQAFYADLGRELGDRGDPEVIAEAVARLQKKLSTTPQLGLLSATLCTRVGGFGDHDEFPTNEAGRYTFLAHSGQQVVVYVEVEAFTSEQSDAGLWVTELSQQLVIYSDRDGIPVQREDWQLGVDATKQRRDDFYLVQLVTLAERLSVGRYHLKIRIRDEKSGAESETALEFEMVADPRLATR